MAVEGTKIVGEAEEGTSQNPVLQDDKYEAAARKSGWKPEKDWEGAEEDWVPAKEFVGRQKLFDKIHDLRNQLSRQASKFETDMSKIQEHFARVQEVEYRRATQELKSQLADAKRAEDVEAVADLAGQIKEVEASAKAAKAEVKEAQKGPTPEFIEWRKDNPWFQKEPEMTADAVAIAYAYSGSNPNVSQVEVLEHVNQKIRKLYPDQFESGGSKKVSDSKVEGAGRGRPETKKKGQLTVGDLDDQELAVMRMIVKRNVLKDAAKKNNRTQQEEYLAQLAERKGA